MIGLELDREGPAAKYSISSDMDVEEGIRIGFATSGKRRVGANDPVVSSKGRGREVVENDVGNDDLIGISIIGTGRGCSG